MKLYNNSDHYKLYEGNMLDMLEVIQPNSIEAIVTDPPYELNFMGKGWDNSGIAFQAETWFKCYQVLKHGGYLLAFGGSRTYHRIACAIEDAGFEIRDTIMWLYGSGFPKSLNIGLAIDKKNGVDSKIIGQSDFPDIKGGNYENNDGSRLIVYQKEAQNEWNGWGTALKPAYEPIIVARKPCEGSCVDNVLEYGVGGLNIDGCRIGSEERSYGGMSSKQPENAGCFRDDGWQPKDIEVTVSGRYPSNVILTYDDTDFREVCGGLSETDDQGAARYFYCAKASKKDRDEGLDQFDLVSTGELQGGRKEGSAGSMMANATGGVRVHPYAGAGTVKRNTHPTVKPCELMQYLVRMVTPSHGTVLDPFNGSGSTGKACMYENRERQAGYKYIGIEITPEYLPIAAARISHACGEGMPDIDSSGEKVAQGQMNIFELLGGNENE